jgi:hypothetical protein
MSVVINGSAGVTTNSGAVYNGIASGTAVASHTRSGAIVVSNITGNTWVASGNLSQNDNNFSSSAGTIALGGALDRVRITTVNGTDTFDAGSINIIYE